MGQHFSTVVSDGYQVFDPHTSAFVIDTGFIRENHTLFDLIVRYSIHHGRFMDLNANTMTKSMRESFCWISCFQDMVSGYGINVLSSHGTMFTVLRV